MQLKTNKKSFIPTIVILLCLAFILRLEVCRELQLSDRQVTNPSIYTDMYTYKHYAEQIVKGEYNRAFYYQPFYYAVFLPSIKQLFGFGVWPVIIFQCLLSVMTIWFASLASSMLWGRRAGIISALLLTFSTIMMLYIPYHLIATLQAFWVALIAYLSLKCLAFERKSLFGVRTTSSPCGEDRSSSGVVAPTPNNRQSIINWSVLGFIISLGILTRGNIWFFVPGIITAAVIARFKYAESAKRNILKTLLPVVCLVIMIILPQIPFAWKNTQITGKFSGPSTAAGAVLSLGNTPESPPGGRDAGTGPGPMEYPETCRFWSATSNDLSVFTRMQRWFFREPMAFCELQWRKMLLFWDRREIPNNIAMEHQGLKSRTLQITGLVPADSFNTPRGEIAFIAMNIIPFSIILLVFSLAGIIYIIAGTLKKADHKSNTGYFSTILKRISNHLGEYLMLYFVSAYWLGTAAFYILARFRTPILPLMAIFAGGYLHSFISTWNNRKKRIMGMSAALIISLIVVNFGYDIYRYSLEASIMKIVRPNGVISPMNDKLLVMDNGPLSFGSWRSVELKQGIPVVKTFSVPDAYKKEKTAIFRIELLWQLPGKAELEINGKSFVFKESAPIRKIYEFPIPPEEFEKITIIPRKMDCRIFILIDFQRDYSRTTLNGKNPGGELVSQMILTENKDKKGKL